MSKSMGFEDTATYCSKCKGTGEVLVKDKNPNFDPKDNIRTLIKCPDCKGSGKKK